MGPVCTRAKAGAKRLAACAECWSPCLLSPVPSSRALSGNRRTHDPSPTRERGVLAARSRCLRARRPCPCPIRVRPVGRLGAVPDPATMGTSAAGLNRSDCLWKSSTGDGKGGTTPACSHQSTTGTLAAQLEGTSRPQCSPPNRPIPGDHAPRPSDVVGAVFRSGCRGSGLTAWNSGLPFPGRFEDERVFSIYKRLFTSPIPSIFPFHTAEKTLARRNADVMLALASAPFRLLGSNSLRIPWDHRSSQEETHATTIC